MKRTLEKRILSFAFLVLALSISVNTGLNIEGFRRDYRDGIILRCQTLAGGLRASIEKVLGLGIPIEELEGINAQCQSVVSNDPEIVYCLVENTVGNPLYSNDPSFVFTRNVEFVAPLTPQAAILDFPLWGRVYEVALPIHAADGEVAGRVRIGFPEQVLKERTSRAFYRALVILAGAVLLVITLVFLFVKRDIIGPISHLCSVAKEIAAGNFRVQVPRMRTSDFNELSQALQEMASSLKERDEKIQHGYNQLEETNWQLQESYEQQEEISGELVRSREMYRSLLEDASDAIIVSDEEDRILLMNKVAETFFGVDRERAEWTNLFQFMEKLQVADLERLYAAYQQVLEGQPLETEFPFVRPTDGAEVIGWLRGSPVVGSDGRRMIQAIVRDVTRERAIQANLEKSARDLEHLNRMKDSFLGVASHELKTPLTVINGYSELILGEYGEELEPGLRGMVTHIAEAGQRLSRIVRDMVDVSLLDGKRLRLNRTAVDANELINKTVAALELFFQKRNQTLELHLGEGLPPLYCDSDRMVQAISNLVINAIKFTPDGGTIRVTTRLLESLRSYQKVAGERTYIELNRRRSPYLEVVIEDNGIGIAEDDQLHIFDKFYEGGKIEEHFTGQVAFKGKGTGLGLTIVKGIIDLHDGEIWAESPGYDPDGCPGSAFHLLLPSAPEKPVKTRARGGD